jgi:hypothetical protein
MGMATFMPPQTPLTAASFAPFPDTLSEASTARFYRHGFQSPMNFGYPQAASYPCTPMVWPYAQNPYSSSPLSVRSLFMQYQFPSIQYLFSPCSIPQYFCPSTPYGMSPAPVPIFIPSHQQYAPASLATGLQEKYHTYLGIDLGNRLDSTFCLSDPPTQRWSTLIPSSPKPITDDLANPKSTSCKSPRSRSENGMSDYATLATSKHHDHQYSAAAVDVITHRLNSMVSIRHKRGKLSTLSVPEKHERAKSQSELLRKRHSIAHC